MLFALAFSGCVDELEDTLVDAAALPPSSNSDVQNWNFSREESFGMTVKNRYNFIGFTKARSSAVWHPMSGRKEVLAGMMQEFFVYDVIGDEYDWNIRMIPNASFEHLIYGTPPDFGNHTIVPKKCSFNGVEVNCMYVEVTPDESLYENQWFPNRKANPDRLFNPSAPAFVQPPSPIKGRQVACYGAWVRDNEHDFWAEIHPMEAIWWKNSSTAADTFYVLCLMDDSNRFDRRSEFDGTTDTTWRPWVAPPMVMEIQIPFEYDFKHQDGYTVDIEELKAHNVVTNTVPNSGDSDDNRFHRLRFKSSKSQSVETPGAPSRVLVSVNENFSNDSNLGVSFQEISKRADGSIIGYTRLTTAFGREGDGNEGYHMLRITVKSPRVLATNTSVFEP